MLILRVYKHELDTLNCPECGADPEDTDYRIDDDGNFIINCFDCELEFKVIVVKPGEKK